MASGDIVYEGRLTWANSSPANTAKVITLPSDEATAFIVEINDPSSVSDLAVVASATEPEDSSFHTGGGPLDIQADSWTVTKQTASRHKVSDWMSPSQGGKLTLKNATILGGSETFIADVRIRRA